MAEKLDFLRDDVTTKASAEELRMLQNPSETRIITMIHNKYYDLTDFKHPGGPVAIALISNRDGTELFESHHLYSTKSIPSILSRYEIPSNPKSLISSSDIYNWELTKSSEFTKALKDLARQEIGQNIKITWFRFFELTLIVLLAISQYILFYQGYWFSVLTMPLTYWLVGVNTFHDAAHFGISWNWKINRLMTNFGFAFSAPYTWYHQHVIGHHSFPNIPGKDPDLYHAPKVIRHSKDVRYRPAHFYQVFTFVFTWLLGVPLSLIFNGMMQSLRRESYNRVVVFGNSKYLNPNSLIFRFIIYFIITHVAPIAMHGMSFKGIVFSIIPIYLFSLFFMISSQINHLTPSTTDQRSENFFVHQILTAHNVAVDNYLVYLFTGGLNMQIEHHLFPSVNHCHLRKLCPKVKKLCSEFGIKYSESKTLWGAICEHIDHLKIYSLKD